MRSRTGAIRKNIIKLSFNAKSAHVGSSLSCVEILDTLFGLCDKDGFKDSTIILSKGHAAMALYATAMEYGLLPHSHIENYLQNGTEIWGHPSVNSNYPFIKWSTGSLGHGLPAACGIAYARKKLKKDVRPIFVVLSDGELNEGSNWEAILFAAQHKLCNLTVVVDYNKIQSFGRCADIINLEPLFEKFKAFNFETFEIDGHSSVELLKALQAKSVNSKIIIAHTIKGKGISEYEDTIESHYKPISLELFDKYTKD